MNTQTKFNIKRVGKYTYFTLNYRLRDTERDEAPRSILLTGKTKEDIYRKIDELEGRGASRNVRNDVPTTVEELFHYFLENQIRTNRESGTYYAYKGYYKRHIEPFFRNCKLTEITPVKAQAFLQYLTEKKQLRVNSALNIFSLLNRCLDNATRYGIFYENPCKIMIVKPRKNRRKATPLNEDELKRFIEYAKENSRFYPVYVTSVYLGTRRGETLGLSWDDYDDIRGTIRVHQQVQNSREKEGERVILKEKTKNHSDEVVGVPQCLARFWREIQAKQNAAGITNNDHLIFTNEDGGRINPAYVTNEYRSICNKLGIRHRLHDLRHTYATAIFEKTGDIVHVATALRDNDIRSALCYVRPSDSLIRENAIANERKMAEILEG